MTPLTVYQAFLFDMDGTLINSIAAAERIWGKWAGEHGLNVSAFLPTIHGARSVDTVAKLNIAGLDPAVEAQKITAAEIADTTGVYEILGAGEFLRSLPKGRWAVVTSAPRALALARFNAARVPLPEVLITAEDVRLGKPNPEGFQLAATKLGFRINDCLVFEDAPVGIRAAEASGADVVVVTATHTHPALVRHPTIRSYQELTATVDPTGALKLTIRS